MSVKMLISRSIGARLRISNIFYVRSYASDVKASHKTESGEIEYDEIPIFEKDNTTEETINKMRDKSRLNQGDLNRIHDKKPYKESVEWFVFLKINCNFPSGVIKTVLALA